MSVFNYSVDKFMFLLLVQIIVIIIPCFSIAVRDGSAENSQIPPLFKNHLKYSESFRNPPRQSSNQKPMFESKYGSIDHYFQDEHHLNNNYSPLSSYEFHYPSYYSFPASQSPETATAKVRRQEQEESGKEHAASSSTHSEGEGTKTEEDLSPFEQAFKNLTTPDQLVPIINDLTLITLIILHLPAIVPTILIPLAFFGVGALLIPFVRINYFINHKDDDEDGRQLTMGWLENILSSVTDKMW